MKTNMLIYSLGIILIITSTAIILLYPESGRYNMIAGGVMLVGLILNIGGFAMKKPLKRI